MNSRSSSTNKSVRNLSRAMSSASISGVGPIRRVQTSTQKSLRLRKRPPRSTFRGRKQTTRGRSLRSKVGTTLTPPRKSVWLEYVSEISVGVGGSHQTYAYPLYTNGAYAPDSSSPSGFTTTPGFSVPATQYAAYRVRRYKGSVSFANTFAAVGDTIVCHSNSNLGSSSGGAVTANILQFAANRPNVNTIKPIQATGNGASQVTHRFDHSIPFITGESINQAQYKSATNTVPSSLTYLVWGWELSAPATSFTMSVSVKLKMLVEFLDYIDTLTSFDVSEQERLSKLGTPKAFTPCAGCASYELLENIPCPDPECTIVDKCTNCGALRRCIMGAQSQRCPYRAETAKVTPPTLTKANSKTLLKGQ